MQKSHQVNTLCPSCHHDKMVDAVVQGVKVLQDLLRLQLNLLSEHAKGGTKFIEHMGQFAKVFEVNRLGSKAWQIWVGQQGGSKFDWLGNKQWIPGKRSVGNAPARSNIALIKNTIDAHGQVHVWQVQQTGVNSNGCQIRLEEGALAGV